MMTTVSADFESRTWPYRRELLAHCYQMLGSVHDAEDLVQETLLRAWRSFADFDETRASLRTWLHRIATNACLNALEKRSHRPLPTGLGGPDEGAAPTMVPGREIPWLQPIPDAALGTDHADPAVVLAARGRLRLAVVAAMQLLPARQRAVLILRDVLDWSAAEVADALETTAAAVNSALQRARARLAELGVDEEHIDEAADPDQRATVDRFVAAFERADLTTLERLLTDDVVLEMPPFQNWYAGPQGYVRFMTWVFQMRGTDWRLVHTAANGQPALAAYVRGDDGRYQLHTLQVLTVTGDRISHNVVYGNPDVFPLFGLSPTLEPSAASG
jgi:RNA polymerase sigma-70 factor (ECF subfamily)